MFKLQSEKQKLVDLQQTQMEKHQLECSSKSSQQVELLERKLVIQMEDFNREKQDMEYQFKSSMSGLEEEYKGIVRSQSEK